MEYMSINGKFIRHNATSGMQCDTKNIDIYLKEIETGKILSNAISWFYFRP